MVSEKLYNYTEYVAYGHEPMDRFLASILGAKTNFDRKVSD